MNPGGGHNGMDGARIVMALPGTDYSDLTITLTLTLTLTLALTLTLTLTQPSPSP